MVERAKSFLITKLFNCLLKECQYRAVQIKVIAR